MKDTFSLKEKYKFWKEKWIKEHLALIIFLTVLTFTALIFAGIAHRFEFIAGIFLIGIGEYIYFRNKMMIYVEHKIYDNPSNAQK